MARSRQRLSHARPDRSRQDRHGAGCGEWAHWHLDQRTAVGRPGHALAPRAV